MQFSVFSSTEATIGPDISVFLWTVAARRLHLVDNSIFNIEDGDLIPLTTVRGLVAFV